jgi:hypothetical protein
MPSPNYIFSPAGIGKLKYQPFVPQKINDLFFLSALRTKKQFQELYFPFWKKIQKAELQI